MAANLDLRTEPSAAVVQPSRGVTRDLAAWVAGPSRAAITEPALAWARHALLDWLGVTIAARDEPLVDMLVSEYAPGGSGPCTLFISGRRATAHEAALINGAAGHALDFDDVAPRMGGHPTAPVAPVVLALGEARRATGLQVLQAFVVGYEVECRIGEMCGPSHYQHGFHATGTMGTFGAAAAAASLMQLSETAVGHALGMAAAQAAGLKSMFGTMTKPLHAGKAAMNGLMAAQLAARGFTANDQGIETAQGFAATQVPHFKPASGPIDLSGGFAVQENLFKYHAACYLTHSTIEALRRLRQAHGLSLDDMASVVISVPESHKKVCDIREPRTGLEMKFSIRHLAGMTLDGCNTADLALYNDRNAGDPRYVEARRRVELAPSVAEEARAAVVTVRTKDGRMLTQEWNVAIPAADLDDQWALLVAKTRAIVTPVLGQARTDQLIAAVQDLAEAPTLDDLLRAFA